MFENRPKSTINNLTETTCEATTQDEGDKILERKIGELAESLVLLEAILFRTLSSDTMAEVNREVWFFILRCVDRLFAFLFLIINLGALTSLMPYYYDGR